ncbi:P22AR C-terminal domain-containing protein [Klebsiella pneumoniae]|uniref:P22AR C-terminal domain-containing protein n=1 Tax=Klebsiella pneumoniae TaxID=573 RepID=UPI0027320972|nr:P22AR C-terminal domain-containing protein [Klebsiella pneumoniae]MDP0922206.1 P22AR C-terminal domain-containing protein [Klebsiella pneumoniae]MDP1224799.1 P22AR C-terminal domain-containing protein [Klebsiella pneumoniae]
MASKNSEAQKCANTLGLLSNKSREGNIDMNSVQNKELTFHNTSFAYMEMGGQVWLTAAEVGQALEYADDKAVQRIYSRHADEFTAQMTGVVKLTTPSGRQESRVFSLRGAHLVAMFARTPKAKEFRRWVLDLLDREVAHSPIAKQFSDEELCSLSYLWRSSAVMYEACHNIYPLLLAAEHKLLPRFASIVTNHARTINRTRDLLRRETKHIEEHPWGDTNWKNVFSYGTGVLQ